MRNIISVQLKKGETVLKIAQDAEQREIIQVLRKKLPELKKYIRVKRFLLK